MTHMTGVLQDYIKRLDSQIREWDRLIDDLEMKAYRQKVDSKVHIYREIGMLRRRQDETSRKLEGLRAACEETVEAKKPDA